MSSVQLHQSITGFIADGNSKAVDYLNQKLSIKNDTSCVKIPIKFTVATLVSLVGSVFHAVFAVASLVEAVARHAFAFVIKIVTFLLPAGISEGIDNKIITPLFKHAQLSLETVPRSFVRVVTNFLSEETRKSADSGISFNKLYDSKLFKGFYSFHWTGFSGNKAEVSTSVVQSTAKGFFGNINWGFRHSKQVLSNSFGSIKWVTYHPLEAMKSAGSSLKGLVTAKEIGMFVAGAVIGSALYGRTTGNTIRRSWR